MAVITNDTGVSFQPAATKRASEIIFDQVREMIVKGELKPGDRLPNERTMMEMFGRSRPTVREALRMLEREGYIRANAGSNGATVLEPSTDNLEQTMQTALEVGHVSIEEMHEYRLVSENASVTWACRRRTDADLKALRKLLDKMAECKDKANYDDYIRMDAEYHTLLAEASKNSVIVMVNKTLSALNRNFMLQKFQRVSDEEREAMTRRVHEMHEAIFNAVVAQDEAKALVAMERHMAAFESDLK